MTRELLEVPRAPFDIEDPWTPPAGVLTVRMRRAENGAVPRLATSVAVWRDASCLSVLFSYADDHVVATHLRHDAPLYEEDVVEAFLAPAELREYFELEVSPRGTLFDARIVSPDGIRATMHADRGWTCEGMLAFLRTVVESDGTMTCDVHLRVPFAALGQPAPKPGETWRVNFFRIDRHPKRGDEFSAWQPTLRSPADFHVADAFGTLRFQ